MKRATILTLAAVAALGAGTVVAGGKQPAVSDAQLHAAIDARLHDLLVRLNEQRAQVPQMP